MKEDLFSQDLISSILEQLHWNTKDQGIISARRIDPARGRAKKMLNAFFSLSCLPLGPFGPLGAKIQRIFSFSFAPYFLLFLCFLFRFARMV